MVRKTAFLGEELKVTSENNVPQSGVSFEQKTTSKWVDILIAAPLSDLFTYQWNSSAEPEPGMRVMVSFGRRKVVGIVHGLSAIQAKPKFKVKQIEAVLDDGAYLTPQWFALLRFCSAYYHYPLGLITLESLPKALRVLNAKGQEPVMARKGYEHVNALMSASSPKEPLLPDADVQGSATPGQDITSDTRGQPARVELNKDQVSALKKLNEAQGFGVHLLYGITGSGKTEVYLHWIEQRLKNGGQALVLLPEINLTPAALALYEKRFSDRRVVVLHSNLAELPRTKNWFEAASGMADVLIATRLGVLTPLPNLQLIVVDEEHDPSYRQQEGMKYNARDVAVVLGKQRNVPVLLGSATPSMESWNKVQQKSYHLLEMAGRAVGGATLPQVKLINTANFKPQNGLSEPVVKALQECFERGQQSIVFLNRRGYAPQMACDACGWVAGCTACSAHMVWHKRENTLRCHHCGASSRVPMQCPDCGNQDLVGFGRGTQKIEETLEGLLPDANVLRIDADSTRNKGQIEHLLDQIHTGQAHVLVGTQMIAKGHDFANIGLVVALNVDSSLFSQSYKAPERLFAQLMQVAGRAGRRKGAAQMLVQTRYPHHPLFEALVKHDYRQFASFELTTRKDARMPPFAFQALLRADHKSLGNCLEFLKIAKDLAQPLLGEWVFVCDPVPLNVVRVADTERAQMLIESDHRGALHEFLDHWMSLLAQQKSPVRWFLEVDPSEL